MRTLPTPIAPLVLHTCKRYTCLPAIDSTAPPRGSHKLLLVIALAIFSQVPLSFSEAGSDCSDCVSQKAGASKVLCGSLYCRLHQRSRACSTPSTFSCCSTTPSFSVHNDDSLADLSSTSNMSFAALPAKLRAASSISYITGGGGGRRKKQAKRGSVDEPSAEFQEQLQCFLSRSGRIKVLECGDGHCGIRCFVRHGNQAIGNEMHDDQIRDRREVGTIDASWRTRNGESSESRRV